MLKTPKDKLLIHDIFQTIIHNDMLKNSETLSQFQDGIEHVLYSLIYHIIQEREHNCYDEATLQKIKIACFPE